MKKKRDRACAIIVAGIMAVTCVGIGTVDVSHAATKVLSLNLTNVGDNYTIKKGKTKKLKYSIKAKKKKYKKVKWKSSNKKVLTVSSNGKIKAKKKGTAYVTVYAKSSKKVKDVVKVTVGTPVSSIEPGSSLYYVRRDKSDTISMSIFPSSASNKSLTWISSNPSVATVSQTGVVTGVQRGVVTITGVANDGSGISASTTVKVVALKKGDAIFIAHRGYSAYYPENTIPAFVAAAEADFDGIEMDVWESENGEAGEPGKPGDLMIMHNENIEAMCGVNMSIKSVTEENRNDYPITKGNGIEKYKNDPPVIPTLEEALSAIAETNERTGFNSQPVIELKAESYSEEAITKIVDLILQYGGKATVISFNDFALNQMQTEINSRSLRASIDTQYLVKTSDRSNADLCVTRGYTGLSIKYQFINSDIISYAHSKGLTVAAWTLPSQVEAAKVIDKGLLGTDRITSNYRLFFDN